MGSQFLNAFFKNMSPLQEGFWSILESTLTTIAGSQKAILEGGAFDVFSQERCKVGMSWNFSSSIQQT